MFNAVQITYKVQHDDNDDVENDDVDDDENDDDD